ncbi:MAG: glycosyltransferase family 39 protein [Acidobacteria bacterium]|nr:glycosyltransferase family 39 protein [Acidobacteriota bacterium]
MSVGDAAPRARWRSALPWIFALGWAGWGMTALDQYGPNWDESLGDLFFGQRYVSFWTSFDGRYLDFVSDPYGESVVPDLRSSPLRIAPHQHYPVMATGAMAFVSLVRPAGLFASSFDAVHAFVLLVAALLIVAMFRWVERHAGMVAASSAVLLLMLSPRVAYHSLVNLKDFGEMALFALTLFILYDAIERGSAKGLIAGGVVWGLALGTKANALFILPIIVVWLFTRGVPASWRERKRGMVMLAFLWPIIGAVTFFVTWPWLWPDPVRRLGAHLDYIFIRGGSGAGASDAPAALMILLTSVPVTLALALGGAVITTRRAARRDSFALFVLVWMFVVLVRAVAGTNFDGIRHFLELFPAIAILAGLAVAWVVDRIPRGSARRNGAVAVLVVALAALPSLVALARSHPFEATWWNVFAGGYRGAVERQLPQASDYWATSHRLGIEWLNAHAEPDAVLVVPIAEHTVRLAAPEMLRSDIELVHTTRFWTEQLPDGVLEGVEAIARRRPTYGMTITRRDWWNPLAQKIADSPRVAEWRHDGEPVLIISRL